MEQLFIIKIGGNVIDDSLSLNKFLKDFSAMPGKKILVHGGGKIATSIGNRLQIESRYIDGRRITDDDTIDLVTMVYGGLVNKKIVALLQSFGCNAMGVTGADGNLIPAGKRKVADVDYGWVGDIDVDKITPDRWKALIDQGITPVVASLTHDGEGHILNTNADTIAAVLAKSLGHHYETSLIYCFEKRGVLEDVNDENSFLKRLDGKQYELLKNENKLFAGILPKLQNAFDAKQAGVAKVIIGSSDELHLLIKNETGTLIG